MTNTALYFITESILIVESLTVNSPGYKHGWDGVVAFHQSGFSSKRLFIKAAFHQSGFSSKRLFIKAAFCQSGFSSKRLFIKAAFHQSSFSSKRLFIKVAFHWIPMGWLFIKPSQKWLIHLINESIPKGIQWMSHLSNSTKAAFHQLVSFIKSC